MKFLLTIILSVITTGWVAGQSLQMELSLEEALIIGREQSLHTKESRNSLQIAYWQYRNYKAELFPSITLDGTLPSLNRSLESYQQEDGVYKFVSSNYIRENLGLTISQAIPFTGGRLYLQSNVERIDQLGGQKGGGFLSIPFNITLVQPIFAYNYFKWAKRVEPLKYEKSQKTYIASMENVNIMTVNHYFNLLFSMVNKNIACQNRRNASELYRIALAKKGIGTISENDVMQLHVGALNSQAAVIAAEQDYSEKMHALRNYLGLDESIEIIPQIPVGKIVHQIDPVVIKEKSSENNPAYQDFKVRMIEAEANIAKARRERNPNVQLYVSAGTTGSDHNFFDSYGNLKNRQIVELGISIPILDWGKRKGQVELAKSQYALVEDQVTREEKDLNEKIRSLSRNLHSQSQLVEIYNIADSISQERYKINFEKFSLGNININDINYAEQEKDNTRRNYINQIYLSWLYYYNLRYITLYDFEKDSDIEYDN